MPRTIPPLAGAQPFGIGVIAAGPDGNLWFTEIGFEQSKGGHLIVRNAEGNRVYALPSTPGRGRWKQNLLTELRRKGIL